MKQPTLKLAQIGHCRFRLVAQQGRGSNRRAIYVCVAHAYPSGCLPYATKPLPR